MPSHLFVLLHGLYGRSSEMQYLANAVVATIPNAITLIITCNVGLTTDGIDRGGKRAADEVREFVHNQAAAGTRFDQLSIIGYSLGGLYARYMASVFYTGREEWYTGMKKRMFVTLATPHLGTSRMAQENFMKWVHSTLPYLGRTFQQLLLREPLLEAMASHAMYVEAWREYEHLLLYSNVMHDFMVHYGTAAICAEHPLKTFAPMNSSDWVVDEQFPTIYDWNRTRDKLASWQTQQEASAVPMILELDDQQHQLAQLIEQQKLPLRRFDIKDRFLHSHFDVIVLSTALNSYGVGIVQHLMHQLMLALSKEPLDLIPDM